MSNSGVNLPRPVTVPQSIEPPTPSGTYHVDSNVLRAFPGDEELVGAQNYGASLWGKSAKIEVKLKSGAAKAYFLKARHSVALSLILLLTIAADRRSGRPWPNNVSRRVRGIG